MKKNENGFPSCQLTAAQCMNVPRQDSGMHSDKDAYKGDPDCNDQKLAYLYSPSQKFCMLYSPTEALKHGTLFENLYKPMEVYGRE